MERVPLRMYKVCFNRPVIRSKEYAAGPRKKREERETRRLWDDERDA